MAYRLAADIGGTFTDIALLSADGALSTAKVPSTPDDYARGILDGCRQLLEAQDIDPGQISEILHASTVATNAILELKGARTALVTTAGFRDVLELRRIRVPRLYEPLYKKPQPLALRRHRYEVRERMGPRGEVILPLAEEDVVALADAIAATDIEAVAVCFLHSYANAAHERRTGEILRERLPERFVTLSAEVLPEIREYERTSTTVINAYVGPPVRRYLGSLTAKLAAAGLRAPLRMMQSSGGILDIASVMAKPAQVVESGPAAGVIGAAYLGTRSGYSDIITLDMGGTTAKAAVIEKGRHLSTDEYEVGGGISLSSRLVKGGGYALKLPVIDVSEVGAGGGSIVWKDPASLLKVGPQSAGAVPGPACYGRGGTAPTVTDANVVLGYLNPIALAGGTVPIDAEAAHRAIASVADDGRDLHDVAYGIVQLATATMMRAVKAVTTYRGRDPGDFTLFAFGGGGGLHAVDLARSLRIGRVVVPPVAGVFSALSLLFANVETGRSLALLRRVDTADPGEIEDVYSRLEQEVRGELGIGASPNVLLRRQAALRYAGQAFELMLDLPAGPLSRESLKQLAEAFEAEHEATYGHRLAAGHGCELIALRIVGTIPPEHAPLLDVERLLAGRPSGAISRRRVYFGPAGMHDTPVLGRADLTAEPRPGPIIVEEYEGTTVVPPDAAAHRDGSGNIVIDLARQGMSNAIDPLTLEIIRNGFETVADEMALILMRTAHSTIVRDSMDYSTAVCDPHGQIVGQGLTTPMHLGSFYDTMRHLIEQFAGDIHEGDLFIANDPYLASGQHLPDIYIIKPIHFEGALVGWATSIAHHADVGGIVPGSNAIGATEIYQEGLRLPLLKLRERGRENPAITAILRANVRIPDKVLGDLNAQIAACQAGERSYLDLVARFGAEPVALYSEALHDYAERLARANFAGIPDGVYVFEDHIDGLGETPVPITFRVAVTVSGDHITTDWTGTSPQVKGGINAPLSFLKSNVYAALRSIMPGEVPNCHGFTRPISVIAPPGSIVNALHPAPCGARGITGYRIADCLFGALAQAVPDLVTADGAGGSTLPTIAGYDRDGRAFVFSECVMGTWGASSRLDGQDGVPHMASNQSNVPIEMVEAEYPIRIERYGLVPDSGGAGQHRGGLALLREYRILADDTLLSVRSDKRAFPPHGLAGGGPGTPSVNILNPGEGERMLPTLFTAPVATKAGDLFRHVMASGGGYGPPLERDPVLVLDDVLDGRVTPVAARVVYGVVLKGEPLAVDSAETARLREAMRRRSGELKPGRASPADVL